MKNKQASSLKCFVCGVENPFGLHLKFFEIGPGEVTVAYTPSENYQGYPGVLHGGIVAAILDEAAGRAYMGISPFRFLFTAKIEVKYRKNVPVGQPLKVVGKAGKDRGRVAEAWSGIYNDSNDLLAEANVLLVNVPNPMSPEQLEGLGWKVYQDD